MSASEVNLLGYVINFQSFHWEVVLSENNCSRMFVLQLNLLLIL